MKNNFRIVLSSALIIIGFSQIAQADALFPLSSGRPQRDGNCWAYGSVHMLEARAEFRDHVAVMSDIEKSYRYYLVYDRLLNSYHRKMADEGDGSGDQINDIGGFSADLFHIYAAHGFEMVSVKATSGQSDFAYPHGHGYRNDFQENENAGGFHDHNLISQTEKALISSSMSEADAIQLIQARLNQAFSMHDPLKTTTPWLAGSTIAVTDSFAKILGADNQSGTHSMVYLSTSSPAVGNKKWLRYDSGRFLGIAFSSKKDVLAMMRTSMDRGWPTTAESIDHVMTMVGYKTVSPGKYVYAVSDSSGAYNPEGISWQSESDVLDWFTDSTVYYDALKDLLPPQDITDAPLPLVNLPRKH